LDNRAVILYGTRTKMQPTHATAAAAAIAILLTSLTRAGNSALTDWLTFQN
jgi:hypothetical protein